MGLSDRYASSLFPTPINNASIRSRILTPLEAVSLSSGLQNDCLDLYYSAWVSFVDALHGIQKGFYTWATVKLYYSVFYSLRASLAVDNYCVFHVGRTQCSISARAGSSPTISTHNGTHKTVLKTFESVNTGHVLCSQEIELRDAFEWLIEKRESANYKISRFADPSPAVHLEFLSRYGLRRTLNSYIKDTSLLYTFDPDHAIISFPLKALMMTGDQLLANGLSATPSEMEQSFLRSVARDKSGQLTPLIDELRRLQILE